MKPVTVDGADMQAGPTVGPQASPTPGAADGGEPTLRAADGGEPEREESRIVLPGPPENEPVSPRTVFRWAIAAALGFLVVSFATLAVYAVRDVLVQIIVAAFIALSLDPLVRWMIQRRIPRSYAVTIIFVVLFCLLVAALWAAVPPLLNQATRLATDFPGYLDHLREQSPSLRSFEDRFNLRPKIDDLADGLFRRSQAQAVAFGQRFLGALVQALLVTVLTIYFMADLPRLRRAIVRVFPKRHRSNVGVAVNVVIDKVGAYMIGNVLISLIAGFSTFLVLAMLGVPFALPLAVFVAVTDLIPLIGATLGAIVTMVVAIATTDLWPDVALLAIFFIVYQQLENYLIAPRVLRNTVDMPSIGVLLAALLGVSVLGLVGALMAIPVAAAIKVLATPIMRARDEGEVAVQDGGG
jgi:predicted PurR-regulated permease PerM